jgi:hypothetical protein
MTSGGLPDGWAEIDLPLAKPTASLAVQRAGLTLMQISGVWCAPDDQVEAVQALIDAYDPLPDLKEALLLALSGEQERRDYALLGDLTSKIARLAMATSLLAKVVYPMTTTTPAAAFAAVVARLAPNADEAQHMVQHGGPAAVTVGKAVLAALKAGPDDSEAGCKAFLAALAPAADEARDLARHGNDRQQQVSKALLAAQAGAAAVDWHVAPPPEQPVSIADGFGDLTLSAAAPTAAAVKLERAGATDVAASCGWQATGPGAIRLARAAGPVGSRSARPTSRSSSVLRAGARHGDGRGGRRRDRRPVRRHQGGLAGVGDAAPAAARGVVDRSAPS